MKNKKNGALAFTVASCSLLAFQAQAFDISVSGFIRQDMAYKFTSDENQFLRGGRKHNGKTTVLTGAVASLIPAFDGKVLTKPDKSKKNDWNVFATRVEVDFNLNVSENVTGFMKLRGVYQPDVFSEVDDSAFLDGQGGEPSQFRIENHGKEATYLSHSGTHYMLDIPALYLDFARGPFWVRVGQQQIAWGEALFFRVADLANGLDLRRHFFLDLGAEEYADERLAAPGIRASYLLSDNWEIEVFAQMFQPSVLPPNGSPYNLIPGAFNPDWGPAFDKVDDQINGGVRLKGDNLGKNGNWGVQFFGVSRHNPDPVFNLQFGGQDLSPYVQGKPLVSALLLGSPLTDGASFAEQPFSFQDGGAGASSAEEWFYLASQLGADGVDVLNGLLGDGWPYIDGIKGFLGLEPDANGDYFTTVQGGGPNTKLFPIGPFPGIDVPGGLNATDFIEFFLILGDIIELDSFVAELKPNYIAEDVLGFGFSHIFYAQSDQWWDQVLFRFETAYTNNKAFSHNGRTKFLEEDEWIAYFGLEKYHRFSQDFPATYLVMQYMWRKESDLLGRHLSGLGGDLNSRPGGGEQDRGWSGIVFALQQPFPNLTWRLSLAIFYDFEKGYLFSPAVTYKPNAKWTVDAFANVIDAGDTASIFQPFDWSDDLTVRIAYQF